MILVVNFPFCNFYSLERYLRVRGYSYQTLNSGDSVSACDTVILPGVGTFGQGMDYLHATGLFQLIHKHVAAGGRVLGICLGMQLLFHASSETPDIQGLGLIPGECHRITESPSFFVPHIGWNTLLFPSVLHPCFASLGVASGSSNSDFYFVHSYCAFPSLPATTIASFHHPAGPITAAVASDNVIGFQFHPEKSGQAGYSLLDQALSL